MEINQVKKILVKLPRNNNEVFETFPFLITLSEEFPKAEINVITEDGGSSSFMYLPFKIKVFERPVHKQSLIETHHYCANLHDVFNIDIYLDLENTLNSSFMGFNFRAKERVGYEVKWNKYLLTKRFPNPIGLTTEDKSMKLLENFLQRSFSDVRISKSHEAGTLVEKIEALFKTPEPPKFMMLMLDNFTNVSRQIDFWKKFFDSFENQKFVIWTKEDEGVISDLFASIDLGKNNLYMHRGTEPKEMVYLLSKMQGVITNNLWAEGLCTYFGTEFVSILEPAENYPVYHYYKYKPRRVIMTNPESMKYFDFQDERELDSVNALVDILHFNFKL
jgi:ADP-heptose:LPS heptosyltransferase